MFPRKIPNALLDKPYQFKNFKCFRISNKRSSTVRNNHPKISIGLFSFPVKTFYFGGPFLRENISKKPPGDNFILNLFSE